ncbi:uncharacterized protein THITE_2113448 [Thermothielavioides terrestris NRRL 8126]|uniref:DNA polymerase epsilon subunit D n=1 Tax=Thermothielavioides terrestris (strain ATCC 38088 / NRRL 8126) TaxID=578455 RepID=G2R2W2_THETT|nr:uncharacterized protein THITE_2113448 [Thermothielavioides terrestris NRRL 8126]AEO65878.1 hypothetical protein THITE_2113448 [Thermothielavioides terrestris NRRL 8126]
MPSRKSDVRRSDVSAARFVLADEDSTMTTESPAPAAPPPPTEPSASGSTTNPQQPSADKKEKDKERERERERERDALTIEDLTLPKSIITRLAKGVLPPNTQIQANAILALTKSATVFINHLANAANEFTVASNKKTIMPADVFKALDEIEYGFMREKLEAEFAKFNEVQTTKRSTYRKKVAAAKKAAAAGGSGPSQDDPDAATGGAAAGSSSSSSAAAAAAGGADVSMMSIASTNAGDGTDGRAHHPPSAPGRAGAGQGRVAKKARLDPASSAGSRMEVDEEGEGEGEVSDAETVPDEEEEEEMTRLRKEMSWRSGRRGRTRTRR